MSLANAEVSLEGYGRVLAAGGGGDATPRRREVEDLLRTMGTKFSEMNKGVAAAVEETKKVGRIGR